MVRTDVQAFLKSMWAVGIASPSRILYWNLVLKTLLTKPKALSAVVEMAIQGLHFARVSQRIMGVKE